jgi:HEAT repeat protein
MKRLIAAVAVAVIVGVAAAAWVYRAYAPGGPGSASPLGRKANDSEWLDKLYSRNPGEVEAATAEVTKRGAAGVPVIQAALRDPQSEAERLKGALKACAILGKIAAPAIADVASVLTEPGLTAEAAIALSNMGPDAFAPLREGLEDDDPLVRRESLRSIGKLKERAPLDAQPVVTVLIAGIKDADDGVRTVAATYLGIVHAAAEESVPALMTALSDSNVEVRREAATALGSFGAAALGAIPMLKKAALDKNEDVAREAGRAVLKLQQK